MSQSVSDSHDLARACRTTRLVAGDTQEDVAERAGIRQPELSRFERCERPRLTFDQAARIVSALGLRLVLETQDEATIDLKAAAS